MASNSVTELALVAQPVPDDLQCPKNGTDIVNVVTQCVSIGGLSSLVPGGGVVPTNNTAAQALALAQANAAAIAALKIPQYRGSSAPIALPGPDGTDSIQNLTFSDLGTTDYVIQVTLITTGLHPASYYAWSVVAGTQASNAVSLAFDGMPSGSSFMWLITTIVL